MSRSMAQVGPTLATPPWAGDYGDRRALVPGGGKLNAADFTAGSDGKKFVPSGTVVGRTIAERDASQGYGPAAVGDADVHIVYHDVADALHINDCTLYRAKAGLIVKETFLPGFGALASGVKDLVRSLYNCVRAAD